MSRIFPRVGPTPGEIAAPMPGDDRLPDADVVMDRAFTLDAPPEVVWPWIVQLGKQRAGWYLPKRVERLIPHNHRAIRHVDPRWQGLAVGDRIPDYGPYGWFDVAAIEAPHLLVYSSRRGTVDFTWAITLGPCGEHATRVGLRLRIDPVRRRWLANSAGAFFDEATIAGMAAGLRERLA